MFMNQIEKEIRSYNLPQFRQYNVYDTSAIEFFTDLNINKIHIEKGSIQTNFITPYTGNYRTGCHFCSASKITPKLQSLMKITYKNY